MFNHFHYPTMSKTKNLVVESNWVLLSLYLTNQADDEQTLEVLEWCTASPKNQVIFEQAQRILQSQKIEVSFNSEDAFKKLNKKIANL
jgi:ferric-dicitrate binding protein FerR (iron transport regulator)